MVLCYVLPLWFSTASFVEDISEMNSMCLDPIMQVGGLLLMRLAKVNYLFYFGCRAAEALRKFIDHNFGILLWHST